MNTYALFGAFLLALALDEGKSRIQCNDSILNHFLNYYTNNHSHTTRERRKNLLIIQQNFIFLLFVANTKETTTQRNKLKFISFFNISTLFGPTI